MLSISNFEVIEKSSYPVSETFALFCNLIALRLDSTMPKSSELQKLSKKITLAGCGMS